MPPLLLADIENVIGAIFVIFWIVAWLMKLLGAQKQKTPPIVSRPRPPARPRDERLQEEINVFMQEAAAKKGGRRPPAATPSRPPVLPKQAASGQRPRKAPVPQKPPETPAPQRIRPGQEISTRQVVRPEKDLGNAVQQHLRQHMAERVAQEASVFLKDKVDQSVTSHLGTSTIAASTIAASTIVGSTIVGSTIATPPGSAPGASAGGPATGTATGAPAVRYSELFRNSAGLRQAMVVNLILSPPPGRKPRSAN